MFPRDHFPGFLQASILRMLRWHVPRSMTLHVGTTAGAKGVKMSKHLGKAEQALYERLRFGALTSGEASFFSRQIGALVASRIARRTTDGGVELVNPSSYVTQAPPAATATTMPPPAESGTMAAVTMPTVTARVPQDVIDYADAIREPGESRGGALRRMLTAAVERGLGRVAVRKAGGT